MRALALAFLLLVGCTTGFVEQPKSLEDRLVLADIAVLETAHSVRRLKDAGVIQNNTDVQVHVDNSLSAVDTAMKTAWEAYDRGDQQTAETYLVTALRANSILLNYLKSLKPATPSSWREA